MHSSAPVGPEKPGRRAPERVPLPGFLSIKWHVVFKMKARRRPVSGRGSQRMLHALERRSHPADHGPSFASLFPPLAAVSSAAIPVWVKLKTPSSECSGSYHGRHSYRMGPATTTTAASGRCREELLGQRPARRKCHPRHARMLGAATRGTKQQPHRGFGCGAAHRRPVRFPYGSNQKRPCAMRKGVFMTRTGIEPMLQP